MDWILKIVSAILFFLKKSGKNFAIFVCIGGFCSLSFILSSNLFLFIFKIKILSLFLGNIVGFFCGYFLQMKVTFDIKKTHKIMFFKYSILNFLILLYSQLILFVMSYCSLPYWLTTFCIAGTIPVFSYPLQKLWVFRKGDE